MVAERERWGAVVRDVALVCCRIGGDVASDWRSISHHLLLTTRLNSDTDTSMSYHVYSLPPSLLDTLTPRNLLSISQSRPPSPEAAPIQSQAARSCTICPGPAATFADADQQRTHYKSDWHRYNLKLRPSQPRVSEPDFARLVDALEDSLSGSASDDDDDDDSDDNDDGKADTKDAVNTLLQKQRALACSRSPSPTAPRGPPQTALAWFHSPPSTQLGVYKALFPSRPNAHLDALREMQAPVRGGRTWALFMVAGGHFAGAVVRVSPPEEDEDDDDSPAKRKKQKKQKPDTEVLLHKTFHRYTSASPSPNFLALITNAHAPQPAANKAAPNRSTTPPKAPRTPPARSSGATASRPCATTSAASSPPGKRRSGRARGSGLGPAPRAAGYFWTGRACSPKATRGCGPSRSRRGGR